MIFKNLAQTQIGQELVKYLEELETKIADIRYKPELSRETRLAVIDIIDEMLLNKIKVNKKEETTGEDNWN